MVGADIDGIELGALLLQRQVQPILHPGNDIHAGDGQSNAGAHTHTGGSGGAAAAAALGGGDDVLRAGGGNLQIAAAELHFGVAGFHKGFRFGGEHMNGQSAGHAEVALRVTGAGGGAGDQLAGVAAGGCVHGESAGLHDGIADIGAVVVIGHGDVHADTRGERALAGLGKAHLIADKVRGDLDGNVCVGAVAVLQGIGILTVGTGRDNLYHFRGNGAAVIKDMDLERIFLQLVAGVGVHHKAEGLAGVHFLPGADGAVHIGLHSHGVGAGDGRTLRAADGNGADDAGGNLKGIGTVVVDGDGNLRGAGHGLHVQTVAAVHGRLGQVEDNGIAGIGSGVGSGKIGIRLHGDALGHEFNGEGNVRVGHHKGEVVIANGSSGKGGVAEGDDSSLIGIRSHRDGNGIVGVGPLHNLEPRGVHALVLKLALDGVAVRHEAGLHGKEHVLGQVSQRSLIGIFAGGADFNVLGVAVTVHIAHDETAGLQEMAGPGSDFEGHNHRTAESAVAVLFSHGDRAVDHAGDEQPDIVALVADVLRGGGVDLIGVQVVCGFGFGNLGVGILMLLDDAAVGKGRGLGKRGSVDLRFTQRDDGAGGVGVGIVVVDYNAHGHGTHQLTAGAAGAAGAGRAGRAGGGTGSKPGKELHVARRHGEDILALAVGTDLGGGLAALEGSDQFQLLKGAVGAGIHADKNLLSGVGGFGVGADVTVTGAQIGGVADGVIGAVIGGHKAAAVGSRRVHLVGQGAVADGAIAHGQGRFTLAESPEDGHNGDIVSGHLEGDVGTGIAAGKDVFGAGVARVGILICNRKGIDGIARVGDDLDEGIAVALALLGGCHAAVGGGVDGDGIRATADVLFGGFEGFHDLIHQRRILDLAEKAGLAGDEALDDAHHTGDGADKLRHGLALDESSGVCRRIGLGDHDFFGVAENADLALRCKERSVALKGGFHILQHHSHGKEAAEVHAALIGDGSQLAFGHRGLFGGVSLNIGFGAGVQYDVTVVGKHDALHNNIHITGHDRDGQRQRQLAHGGPVDGLDRGGRLQIHSAAGRNIAGLADRDLIAGNQHDNGKGNKKIGKNGVARVLNDRMGAFCADAAAGLDHAVNDDLGARHLDGCRADGRD